MTKVHIPRCPDCGAQLLPRETELVLMPSIPYINVKGLVCPTGCDLTKRPNPIRFVPEGREDEKQNTAGD